MMRFFVLFFFALQTSASAAPRIAAYSEYMPAPELGTLPYHALSAETLSAPTELSVSRLEERENLQPGLRHLAKHWLDDLQQLASGHQPGGDTLRNLPQEITRENPYWPGPENLPSQIGAIVSLSSVSLSKTQDEKGKHPWTVFGGVETDVETSFWESLPAGGELSWLKSLVLEIFGDTMDGALGVVSSKALSPDLEELKEVPLPKAKAIITFQPYSSWPETLRRRFREGKVHVLPHPVTLVFWGAPAYQKLAFERAEGAQLPLARAFSGYAGFHGLKILKVTPLEDDASWRRRRRAHRFAKTNERHSDGDLWGEGISPFQMIFEPIPDVIGLYGKPIARNTQIWSKAGKWVLHGPEADADAIEAARQVVGADRRNFLYRDYFAPMRIHDHEIRWHRPLVAWKAREHGIRFDLLGNAIASRRARTARIPVTLVDESGVDDLVSSSEKSIDAKKIIELGRLLKKPLSPDLASSLITSAFPAEREPGGFAQWKKTADKTLVRLVEKSVDPTLPPNQVSPLTFSATVDEQSTYHYEKEYWRKLVDLTQAKYHSSKNNVDCPSHEPRDHCHENLLPVLTRDELGPYYRRLGLDGHDHLFDWVMDFKIPWWGGLEVAHRNFIVVIPGDRHDEAVIMADHYDTAYMADIYERLEPGHRHASPGADDNHSATVALMEAARALSKVKLKRDVWLVHLTGEEFPADCLGARVLSEHLIQGKPIIRGKKNPRIVGLYVLDMVAHNTDRGEFEDESATRPKVSGKQSGPSIFQIAPGRGEKAARLAVLAHGATQAWNARVEGWNGKQQRKPGWRRDKRPEATAAQLAMRFPRFTGEIRPWWHPRSALFNTDGQIFSDAGIPAVLFMENYNIDRFGYHDTWDDLIMIDLDYGAGLTRIAIEAVAQAANDTGL